MAFVRERVSARAARMFRPGLLIVAACCWLALAACNRDDHTAPPCAARRHDVAFESIDGLPRGQFHELVQALNTEAQTRRLAVLSRESPAAYRVRGYASAQGRGNARRRFPGFGTSSTRDERRALRISGEETADRPRDAWSVADDAMLQRIARDSMDQLSAFLTSPMSRRHARQRRRA